MATTLQVPPHPLQVHTALTNLLLLLAGVAAVYFNLDYGLPIVWRPEEVASFFAIWHQFARLCRNMTLLIIR